MKKANFISELFFYIFVSILLLSIFYKYQFDKSERELNRMKKVEEKTKLLKVQLEIASIKFQELNKKDTIVMPKGGSLEKTLKMRGRKKQIDFADKFGYKTKFNETSQFVVIIPIGEKFVNDWQPVILRQRK